MTGSTPDAPQPPAGRSAARRHLLYLTLAFLLSRALLSVVGEASLRRVGYLAYNREHNLHLAGERSALVEAHYRWDAVWYADIAENGYLAQVGNPQYEEWDDLPFASGFFPLLPSLIRIVHLAIPSWAWAGIATGWLLGWIALLMLYRELASALAGEDALFATLLVLLFPSSLFLTLPFAEALLMIGFLALARGIRKGQWEWAVLGAVVTVLAKPPGLLLPVALLFCLRGRRLVAAAAFAGWAAGLGALLLSFQGSFGSVWAPFARQSLSRGEPSGPWQAFVLFVQEPEKHLFGWRGSWIDLIWAVGFLALLLSATLRRRCRGFPCAWSWALLLVPLCSSLVSFQRLSVVVWPVYAEAARPLRNVYVRAGALALLAAAQLYWMFRYATWQWLG